LYFGGTAQTLGNMFYVLIKCFFLIKGHLGNVVFFLYVLRHSRVLINDAFDFYDEFPVNSFILTRLDVFFHHLKLFFKWYFVTEVNIIKGSS
jgi:hypothetical protein